MSRGVGTYIYLPKQVLPFEEKKNSAICHWPYYGACIAIGRPLSLPVDVVSGWVRICFSLPCQG